MYVNCVVVTAKRKVEKKKKRQDTDCEINEIFVTFVID